MVAFIEDEANGGTKPVERLRRSQQVISTEIMFDETMVLNVFNQILRNLKNKNSLISMLMTKFTTANKVCKQTIEDVTYQHNSYQHQNMRSL